jgi:hypothetical protein
LAKARVTLALISFTLSVGIAAGTLIADRVNAIPVEIAGSPTPPEHSTRNVSNLFGGGDFATRAPDGEAHARVRFSEPVAFVQIVHTYPLRTDPPWRIRRAAMQWSDDGSVWTEAAQGVDSGRALVFDVSSAGAHAHWRLLVLESGEAADVGIGNLTFIPRQNFFA